jgi:hypothetical protein
VQCSAGGAIGFAIRASGNFSHSPGLFVRSNGRSCDAGPDDVHQPGMRGLELRNNSLRGARLMVRTSRSSQPEQSLDRSIAGSGRTATLGEQVSDRDGDRSPEIRLSARLSILSATGSVSDGAAERTAAEAGSPLRRPTR